MYIVLAIAKDSMISYYHHTLCLGNNFLTILNIFLKPHTHIKLGETICCNHLEKHLLELLLKAPYSSNIDFSFFIQERFDKWIYSINTIIKWGN